MHKRIVYILLSIFFVVTSCSKDDGPDIPPTTSQTLFMYMPWSGNSNPDDPYALTSDFYNNIKDIEAAMSRGIISNERILVFISTSPTEATLFELKYENKKNVRNTLKNYTNPPFTTAEGITSILNDVKSAAPADRYAMTIGCHGMGWIPVSRGLRSTTDDVKMHWEYTEGLRTRYFGGTSVQYQTDITTLAEGISNAGMKMEYILLDDCYMSTIEVAYDLKNVADYLIGCPTEILAYGMPYDEIGQYLIGNVDYESITEAFYNFYNNYKYNGTPAPYGTIGVTKCSEVDNLAAIMKEINGKFTFDSSLLNSLQRMDGYNPVTFFDFGDYVSKLCTDTDLLQRFEAQLKLTVPYKRNTKQFYTSNGYIAYDINRYSGITISDPSKNSLASAKAQTAWYKATH